MPPLWRMCTAALAASGRLQHLATLPALRPAVVDALAAEPSLRLDKRTLALLVDAGATQLRIRDFWELCCHEFPGWEFWRADVDRFPLRPGVPRMRLPDHLVRLRDGLLCFDPERWTEVFAWGGGCDPSPWRASAMRTPGVGTSWRPSWPVCSRAAICATSPSGSLRTSAHCTWPRH